MMLLAWHQTLQAAAAAAADVCWRQELLLLLLKTTSSVGKVQKGAVERPAAAGKGRPKR